MTATIWVKNANGERVAIASGIFHSPEFRRLEDDWTSYQTSGEPKFGSYSYRASIRDRESRKLLITFDEVAAIT